MQPSGNFIDAVILYHGDNNRQPKGDENNKRNDKRLHIKEKYAPRKIKDEADGIDKKGIVFFRRITGEYDCRANAH